MTYFVQCYWWHKNVKDLKLTIGFSNEDLIGEHSRNVDRIFPNILKQIMGMIGGNEGHIPGLCWSSVPCDNCTGEKCCTVHTIL